MKMTTLKFVAIAVGLASSAFGQATSPVVGFETLEVNPGLNLLGLRLHQTPVATGTFEVVNANSVVDNDVDLGSLMDGSTFVLEFSTGEIQEVTSAVGTGLVTADTAGIAAPAEYTLRPADTLASVFGSTPVTPPGENISILEESGITVGQGGLAGADQVWLWNGSGFDRLYFDLNGGPNFDVVGWFDVNSGASVSAATNLIYADGFIISSASGNDLTVAGDLKNTQTQLSLAPGINVVGSVAPVGSSLQNVLGSSIVANELFLESGIAIGSGGVAGVDQVWIFNGSGFDRIYFDQFGGPNFDVAGWFPIEGGEQVDAETTDLGAGYIISASGATSVNSLVPNFFTGL